MVVRVNGKRVQSECIATVAQLLSSLHIDPSHVVVEVNRTILGQDECHVRHLYEGDDVEILKFVGGG